MRTYKGIINCMRPGGIFVFGSNTEGRHSKGAALMARLKFGAIYGQAEGLQGNSWAIVTKDLRCKTHPSIKKEYIIQQIQKLYSYAYEHPDNIFYIAYSGKGINLNAYTPEEMAEMFAVDNKILPNVCFEQEFAKLVVECIKHNKTLGNPEV